MRKRMLFCSLTLVGGIAAAQPTARPDPADPKAPVPVRPYASALKEYRPYADQEAGRWRESNDEMGRVGGHAGHVPQRATAPARPDARPPTPAGHGGHK